MLTKPQFSAATQNDFTISERVPTVPAVQTVQADLEVQAIHGGIKLDSHGRFERLELFEVIERLERLLGGELANHIRGPLYYERMGRTGPVIAFIHPNPMDQSCWIFQMAHLSTWYRCIAIDIPGYGRSPKAQPGLTMADMAQACWEAIDDAAPGEPAILVGCSVGSALAPHMHHRQPKRTAALVLSGTGYNPGREFTKHRIACYKEHGT